MSHTQMLTGEWVDVSTLMCRGQYRYACCTVVLGMYVPAVCDFVVSVLKLKRQCSEGAQAEAAVGVSSSVVCKGVMHVCSTICFVWVCAVKLGRGPKQCCKWHYAQHYILRGCC